MHKLGLKDSDIQLSVATLTELLQEQFMLFGNILNVHWNIEGKNFIGLHKLLEEHYEFVKNTCDELAERIRVFGIKAPAKQQKNLSDASMSEIDEHNSASQFIEFLANDYEKVIYVLRHGINQLAASQDFGTKCLLEDQILAFEKLHWELISNL